MLFSVHKRLGIAPNIEHQVVKVPAYFFYLASHPRALARFGKTGRTSDLKDNETRLTDNETGVSKIVRLA